QMRVGTRFSRAGTTMWLGPAILLPQQAKHFKRDGRTMSTAATIPSMERGPAVRRRARPKPLAVTAGKVALRPTNPRRACKKRLSFPETLVVRRLLVLFRAEKCRLAIVAHETCPRSAVFAHDGRVHQHEPPHNQLHDVLLNNVPQRISGI